jgi:hypothetical protein
MPALAALIEKVPGEKTLLHAKAIVHVISAVENLECASEHCGTLYNPSRMGVPNLARQSNDRERSWIGETSPPGPNADRIPGR